MLREGSTSGVTRGRGTAPGDTLQGWGDTRPEINFLWLNLERTLENERLEWSGEERRAKKPRVTPSRG